MALKEREAPEEQQADDAAPEHEPADVGDDAEQDVDVEQSGSDVTVRRNSDGTRGQRRARERQEREEQHAKELETLRAENAETKRLLQELSQRLQAPQQAPAAAKKPAEDDLDPEYLDIVREQDELAERASRARTQEQLDAINRKWHVLERKRIQKSMPSAPHPKVVTDELSYEERQLVREFEPVVKNQAAFQLAKSYFIAAEARAKHARVPFSEREAHREAMTKAGEEFGIFRPKTKPPSDATRGRFAGERDGGPGGGQGESIKLTEAEKRSAKTWGSDLLESGMSEAKVLAKYASILMKDKDYMASRKA